MSGPYETWTNQICRFITLEGMKKTSEKRYQQVLFGISCWWFPSSKNRRSLPIRGLCEGEGFGWSFAENIRSPRGGGNFCNEDGGTGGKHLWKLTWLAGTSPFFNRKYMFKLWGMFHCHVFNVSFRGGRFQWVPMMLIVHVNIVDS